MYLQALFNISILLCFHEPMSDEFKEFSHLYLTSGISNNVRWLYYCTNKALIDALNERGELGFKLDINEYADVDPSSFFDRFYGFGDRRSAQDSLYPDLPDEYKIKDLNRDDIKDALSSVDYRKLLQSPIGQKECQSSYAITTMAALSAKYALANEKNETLFSTQYFLNCGLHNTCTGGYEVEVIEQMRKYGLVNEVDLPYRGQVYTCKNSLPITRSDFYTNGFRYMGGDVEVIKHLISTYGPVMASMTPMSPYLLFYKDGIYDQECSSKENNLLVLITGYGQEENGSDYWIVRNVLGSNWGQNGYIKIRAGKNLCDLERENIYFFT